MTGEALLIAVFVGVFIGWLVHLISQGIELPLLGSLALGSVGAIFGEFFLPYTGLNLGHGDLAVALNAGLGGALLLWIFKFMRPDDDRKPIARRKP